MNDALVLEGTGEGSRGRADAGAVWKGKRVEFPK